VKGTATGAIPTATGRLPAICLRHGPGCYIDNVNPAESGTKYNDWHDKGARGSLLTPNNDLSVRSFSIFPTSIRPAAKTL